MRKQTGTFEAVRSERNPQITKKSSPRAILAQPKAFKQAERAKPTPDMPHLSDECLVLMNNKMLADVHDISVGNVKRTCFICMF
jgi:hypothetical protein